MRMRRRGQPDRTEPGARPSLNSISRRRLAGHKERQMNSRGSRRPALERPRDGAAACAAEPLESRTLLSFGPAGPEFRVNTQLRANQEIGAVASDADGNFVVAWASFAQDAAGGYGVYARRYDR